MDTRCPNCGDDEGMISTYWEQRTCSYSWNGEMHESDAPTGEVKFRKTGTCINCGKTMKIKQSVV